MEKKLCKEAEEYISTPIEVNDFVKFDKNLIYAGKCMTKEHLDYVDSILKKM